MRTMSLDVRVARPRPVLRWAAITVAAALAIGLLIIRFSSTGALPQATISANVSQSVAAGGSATPEPVTSEIVPSPVIETNAQFFFGSGDGSAGYYSERPMNAEQIEPVDRKRH
jgi:hypothetical protein